MPRKMAIVDLVSLLVSLEWAPSRTQARHLIRQGAVRLNGEKILAAEDMHQHWMKRLCLSSVLWEVEGTWVPNPSDPGYRTWESL